MLTVRQERNHEVLHQWAFSRLDQCFGRYWWRFCCAWPWSSSLSLIRSWSTSGLLESGPHSGPAMQGLLVNWCRQTLPCKPVKILNLNWIRSMGRRKIQQTWLKVLSEEEFSRRNFCPSSIAGTSTQRERERGSIVSEGLDFKNF